MPDSSAVHYAPTVRKTLTALILLALLGCSARDIKELSLRISGEEWTSYAESDLYRYYFNTATVDYHTPRHAKVWVKYLPKDDEAKIAVVRELQKSRPQIGMADGYQFTMVRHDIDCVHRMIRTITVFDYTADGMTRMQAPYASDWTGIPAGSDKDRLHRAVCPPSLPVKGIL